VKRRHRDIPARQQRSSLKNRLQTVSERAVSGGSVAGSIVGGVVVSAGRSSPSVREDDDDGEGGSSPIAGPSGFVPSKKSTLQPQQRRATSKKVPSGGLTLIAWTQK
jgi:hypothetical protein